MANLDDIETTGEFDTSYWRDHPFMQQPDWLWPGYHCTYDKELQRDWGITCGDYFKMYDDQDGKCALCSMESERRFDVDHDHRTKEVRGLLCRKCNRNLSQTITDYILDPPARIFAIRVNARRVLKRDERLEAKRQQWAKRQERKPRTYKRGEDSSPPTEPEDSFGLSEDDEEKLRQAIESSL